MWRDCFTDDTQYINHFIEKIFPHSIFVGLFKSSERENALSIASLLPAYTLVSRGSKEVKVKGGYLYGVGTLLTERGRGHSRAVIEKVIEVAKEQKLSFIVLRPATEELYSLYEKLSFTNTLYSNKSKIRIADLRSNLQLLSAIEGKPVKIVDLDIDRYFEIKESSCSKTHILWDKELLKYGIEEAVERGGSYGAVLKKDDSYLIFCYYISESNTLTIVDHNAKNQKDIFTLLNTISVNEGDQLKGVQTIEIEWPLVKSNQIKEEDKTTNVIINSHRVRNSLFKILTIDDIALEELVDRMISLPIE